jgi:transposase
MSGQPTATIVATIGIDIGKNTFHLVGFDQRGNVVLQLKTSRQQLERRLAGIGPIISSAVVAAIGNGTGFRQGRDFGAWLGLVPKQESTGDRTILGKISKRGNKYLRTLFVQAAHVILARRPSAAMRGLWPWIEQASKRLHRNMLAIALANKLARIAWAVLAHGREYQPRIMPHAA